MPTIRPGWIAAAVILATLILDGSGTAQARSSAAARTSASAATSTPIDANDLRVRVGILADDSLRGREAGAPGATSAANYLAAESARLGLRPAGDSGGYLQRVPLGRRRTRVAATATVAGTTIPLELDQLVPLSGIAGLPGTSRRNVAGPLVFAGHLVDPAIGADELTHEQLRNAVVIVRLGLPAGVAGAATPREQMAILFSPMSPAAAVLLVAEEPEASLWEYATEIAQKGELALGPAAAVAGDAPAYFLISEAAAERLIGGALDDSRKPKLGLGSAQFALEDQIDVVDAWNVAAILPGRDPALAGEYVAMGAHYDHVGVGAAVDGDSIYNGADDDGSGTSTVLEVAEAMVGLPTAQRPARSMLFIWHTAEEAGLLGSEHFTDHPTIPRESIVADVNIDMVGRNGVDSLYVVGASRLSSQLGELVETVNRGLQRPFTLDYSYDPEGHPEQIYCRSDHYNYGRYGIPIVFLTSGLHDDYHAPSDEVDKLNYEKLARVGEYVFRIATEIANRPGRLVIDKPVPPLGAPCS